MTKLTSFYDKIICDASTLINLYYSGRMTAIIKCVNEVFVVSEFVQRYEIKSFDIEQFIRTGLIQLAIPDEDEEEVFLDYARHIHDGEAYTAAIAEHRGWAIAIDDQIAAHFLRKERPTIQLISTPELIKHWTDSRNPSDEEVRQAIINIQKEDGGRWKPSVNDLLYEWWTHRLSS